MPPKGQHLSEETKLKMRLACLGKKTSLETRARLSVVRTGKKRNPNRHRWSEELRHRWSLAHHNISEKTREKLRIAGLKKIGIRKLTYPEKKCDVCGILIPERYKNNGLSKWLSRRFCSKPCKGVAMRGVKRPPMSEEQKGKIRVSLFGKRTGESNPNWKGGRSTPSYYRLKRKLAEGHYTVKHWNCLKMNYGYTCPACGRKEPDIKLTVDHIVPSIKGGSNCIANIQPLCFACNTRKMTKVIRYPLKRKREDNATISQLRDTGI